MSGDKRLRQINFHASAAISSSGRTSGFEVTSYDSAVIFISITAASGTTPTIVFTVEGSFDNATFYKISDFAQMVTTGDVSKIFSENPYQFVRVSYIVGGASPSFTTVITGEFKT